MTEIFDKYTQVVITDKSYQITTMMRNPYGGVVPHTTMNGLQFGSLCKCLQRHMDEMHSYVKLHGYTIVTFDAVSEPVSLKRQATNYYSTVTTYTARISGCASNVNVLTV